MTLPGKFIWTPLVLLLAGCGSSTPETEGRWVKAVKRDAPGVVREIGILEAKELARIQSRVDGTVSEIVEDGSRVNAGDTILKVDDEELRSKLETELENLEQTREDLENELAEYAVLTNSFEMTSRLKQAELDHARLRMETEIVPLTPEEQRLGEIEIELAELDLADRQSQLLRETELVEKGFAAASSLQTIKREKEAAETFLAEKRSQLKLAGLPLPEEERLTLLTAVKNAEDAVNRNQEKQERDLRIQNLKIEGLELKIQHQQESIALLRKQLEHVELRTPTGGIVRLTQNWRYSIRGWMPLGAGQRVRNLGIVASIVDPDDLSLRVILHESDFPKLRTGQPVNATLTSFPENPLRGEVVSLTELGQDRNDLSPIYRQSPAMEQALFLIRVALENINPEAMPGMTAVAEIEVEPPSPHLAVPADAVRSVEDKFYVVRRRNGGIEEVEVSGSERAGGWFEITDGLVEGDEVKTGREIP